MMTKRIPEDAQGELDLDALAGFEKHRYGSDFIELLKPTLHPNHGKSHL